MKKVDKILREAFLQLEQGAEELDQLQQDGGGDIAEPQEAEGDQKPEGAAPLTSKGEEYLLKLAYLALLFTPKEDEMMQIKNTFESSGIHDETSIQAETPKSISDTKNILVNILSSNNTTALADQLNQVQ